MAVLLGLLSLLGAIPAVGVGTGVGIGPFGLWVISSVCILTLCFNFCITSPFGLISWQSLYVASMTASWFVGITAVTLGRVRAGDMIPVGTGVLRGVVDRRI